MPHRAEQIIAAVVTNVTGLTTTGANVNRGRTTPEDAVTSDWLDVFLGPDAPNDDNQNWTITDSELTVYIDINCKTSSSQIDTRLNLIRSEITVALWTDYQQGLSFVTEMREGPADEPQLSGEANKPAATMRTTWLFRYRRSTTNPDI